MESLKYFILAITIVMLAMPVKQGNMLKNEVTPAPPLDFTEIIGNNAKYEESTASTLPAKKDLQGDSDLEATTVEIMTPEKLAQKHLVSKVTTKKKSRKLKQPVCKYGMSEIFLFGKTDPQTLGNSIGKDDTDEKHLQIPDIDDGKDVVNVVKVAAENNETGGLKSEDGDENMKLEVDDMQSFEEWKHLKLQEQEIRMAEKDPLPVRSLRAKKTQVNYASQDCGAKVLATNQEAKHVSAILDENRDVYMLNPCSTSIWFVIELCEPIQVQQLQLGNMELFSSAPKQFSVSVSERYPARDWHSLGTFLATNERNLQTFVPQTDEQMFAKYIKFEMLSHFSNEHFCPLTLVRVLGVSMVDEFDESDQSNIKDDASEEASAEAIVDEGAKADSGPINTMLNMVKNAMDHVLSNGEDDSTNKQLGASSNNIEKGFDSNDTDTIDYEAESEVFLVTNETEVAGLPENSTHSFITLIETGHGEDISEYLKNLSNCSPRKIPLCIPKFIYYLAPISQKLNVHMCWFLEFFCKVSLAGCLVHYPYNYSAIGLLIPMSRLSIPPLSKPIKVNDDGSDDTTMENITHLASDPPKLTESSDDNLKTKMPLEQPEGNSDKQQLNFSGEVAHADEPKRILEQASQNLSALDKKVNNTLDPEPKSTVVSEVQTEDKIIPDKIVDDNDQTVDVIISSNHSDDINTGPPTSNITATTEGENSSTETAQFRPTTVENSTEGSVLNATKSVPNTIVSEIKPSQPPVVINPGTNQKDSVFMRLSNRIRVLEQNMSLSSDYLETLSQRYKKQMDEMQRAFNQTTSKLLSTSKKANENDARQTELIQQAQAEIQIITQQLHNLTQTHDQLNMQLVERHVCLIIFEIIVFVAILVTCLGRRMAQAGIDIQRAETMIENLEGILLQLQHDTKTRSAKPNGHCSPIPISPTDYQQPPPGVILKHSKKQKRKRHSSQKILDGFVKGLQRHKGDSPAMTGTQPVPGKQLAVEEVGNKARSGSFCCARHKQQSWDGNTIALKIPNGHVKGRK